MDRGSIGCGPRHRNRQRVIGAAGATFHHERGRGRAAGSPAAAGKAGALARADSRAAGVRARSRSRRSGPVCAVAAPGAAAGRRSDADRRRTHADARGRARDRRGDGTRRDCAPGPPRQAADRRLQRCVRKRLEPCQARHGFSIEKRRLYAGRRQLRRQGDGKRPVWEGPEAAPGGVVVETYEPQRHPSHRHQRSVGLDCTG